MADQTKWGAAPYAIRMPDGSDNFIAVGGRDRWALEALIAAGETGCTPIENPAPRWSGYIHNLRGMGVPIETLTEQHGGPFAGTHGRYRLTAPVSRMEGIRDAT